MTRTKPSILLFGGSFDPVHYGHLRTLQNVQNHMPFSRVFLLPCKSSALKNSPEATPQQRIAMLKLALVDYPHFSIDCREIERAGPSYMVDTLYSFRQEYDSQIPISLLIGHDAFLQLPQWHEWQKLLTLCHLIVIHRPSTSHSEKLIEPVLTLLQVNETQDKNQLLSHPCGSIYQYNAGDYPISSTEIRSKICHGQGIDPDLPPQVAAYIKAESLYNI